MLGAMAAQVSKRHSCFICGSLKEKENVKIGIFVVTKDRLIPWQSIIVKKGLKLGSKLCDIHFDKNEIQKGQFKFDTYYPMKVWKLADGAKPQFYLGKF